MDDEAAAGAVDRAGDGLPVPGRQGAQVDHLGVQPFDRELLGGEQRALDGRPPGDDGEVAPWTHGRRPSRRDDVVRSRVGVGGVALAEEVLVLEEQHRVLAPEGGAQEPRGVAGAVTGT